MFQNRNCIDIKSAELYLIENGKKNKKKKLTRHSFKHQLNKKGATEQFEIFTCDSI